MKTYLLLTFFIFILFSCSNETDKDANKIPVFDSQMYLNLKGKGHHTIIFENGMASDNSTWQSIPENISTKNKVITYDRLGVGKSDSTQRERTIPAMVNELRQALQKQQIQPPYILVAHSMGSYVSRYYALMYPNEVEGLLLVDPSPDQMYEEYTEQEYAEFKAYGDDSFKNAPDGEKAEWNAFLNNRKYIVGRKIPNLIPMTILSATKWDFFDYHKQILNDHPASIHLKIEGGHDLHQEKPELIIKEVEKLVGLAEED